MKTIEYHYPNLPWLDRLLNAWPLCLHVESIKPLLEVEYGANPKSPERPAFSALSIRTGVACSTRSLFRNGVFYLRLLWPFGVFVHLRWCGPCRRAFLQAGIGWKLNGRFAILFRIQSDESAERGTWGRNSGQAKGWAAGEH
jgi:hypothetical protein